MAGLKGAEMGALTGGLIGGISGGINIVNHGGDFLTGDGATFDLLKADIPNTTAGKDGGKLEYNNNSAKKFSVKYFHEPKGLNQIHADGTVPAGYKSVDGAFFNPEGKEISGTTHFSIDTKTSDVYFPKTSFQSHDILFMAMQHEYIHVALNNIGWSHAINSQEVSAYDVTIRQAQAWGYDATPLISKQMQYLLLLNDYSPRFNIDFLRTIRNVRPW